MKKRNISIIGAGGFAREVYRHLQSDGRIEYKAKFYVDDIYWKTNSDNIFPLSEIKKDEMFLIAIGDSTARERIANIYNDLHYFTYRHSSALIMDLDGVKIGEGSIICAGSILTTNISIGKHSHLNLQTTIGHDCIIGDYFTTAPGVKISGNSSIGNRVYFGTNASCREKIKICDDSIFGLNAGVIKDISEPGTYVGTPAKKLNIV